MDDNGERITSDDPWLHHNITRASQYQVLHEHNMDITYIKKVRATRERTRSKTGFFSGHERLRNTTRQTRAQFQPRFIRQLSHFSARCML
jgi:hypothetical protein